MTLLVSALYITACDRGSFVFRDGDCQDIYIPGDTRRMCEPGEAPKKSNKDFQKIAADCQDIYIPGDPRRMCAWNEKPISSNTNIAKNREAELHAKINDGKPCQEYYTPGDTRRMCDPSMYESSPSPQHNSQPEEQRITVGSIKETRCIFRQVVHRKKGGNSMSDREIAVLCDHLY